ncbi:unnamed protein product, partial [Meganyctiphanes norvegica]
SIAPFTMAGLRLAYLIPILAMCYIQGCYGVDSLGAHDGPYNRNLPCPNPEDIAPCTCTYVEDDGAMDMDCDNIADEDELYQVFHSLIPFPIFRKLRLPADRLTTLSENVFGNATFEEVAVKCSQGISQEQCNGTLTTVDPNTFIKSASTLIILRFWSSKISTFPFETLGNYLNLNLFVLNYSPLASFPIINSETITELALNYDTYQEIPPNALDGLPNLKTIVLEGNSITSMAKDLFAYLPDLVQIIMNRGGLHHLHSQQFAVSSTNLDVLVLQSNLIEDVEPDTFIGVQSGTIVLYANKLTTLPEDTWKPLLDAEVFLQFGG